MRAGNRHSADGNNPDGRLPSFSDDDERQPHAVSVRERCACLTGLACTVFGALVLGTVVWPLSWNNVGGR